MNLTEIAFYSRSAIKWVAIFVVVLIVGRFTWNIAFGIYRNFFPAAAPPPTVAWGALPSLHFPEKPGLPTFTYTLQTATGDLPVTPVTIPVYFMPKQQISFLKLEEAKTLANSLGFEGEGMPLSETIYRFTKRESSLTLDINTVNKTLSVNYRLSDSPELLTLRPKSQEEAASVVKSFLSSGNLLTEDLQKGTVTYEYLRVEENQLVPAVSLSESNFVRVNLWRSPIEKIPVVSPSKTKSNVWFLITGEDSRDRKLIAGEYHYFPIDFNQSSTYPLKTSQIAWDELVAGKGYITSYPLNLTKIVIRKVYVAYYDSGTPQGFLQPVVVFEGDGGFTAYIPAVSPECYGDTKAICPAVKK